MSPHAPGGGIVRPGPIPMKLEPYIDASRVLLLREVGSRDDVLRRLAERAAAGLGGQNAEGTGPDELLAALLKREEEMPTTTPEGVAFPHALLPGLSATVLAAAVLKPAVRFGSAAQAPIDVVFAMVGPKETPWEHLRLLARLARISRREGALERLRAASDDADLHARLIEEDRADG